MLEIDGSLYSGSGMIVRQAVLFAALTQQSVHITNARLRRPKPGLQPQHVHVIEAIRQLTRGETEGVQVGSRDVVFRPGRLVTEQQFTWDIGTAGSTTMLALALLPLLAFGSVATKAEVRGGLFQDFAPTFFHLQHVMLPLLSQMGIHADIEMVRPGYVPTGGGILCLTARPLEKPLQPLVRERQGALTKIWGIALASHLEDRQVGLRMAKAAHEAFDEAGYAAEIQVQNDSTSFQAGAALAAFADLETDIRLGADRAGAPRRRAEAIGKYVARHLLEDLRLNATLDRHAADQLIPFAALADGESRVRIPCLTAHIQTGAWLAHEILGSQIVATEREMIIRGVGWTPTLHDPSEARH